MHGDSTTCAMQIQCITSLLEIRSEGIRFPEEGGRAIGKVVGINTALMGTRP